MPGVGDGMPVKARSVPGLTQDWELQDELIRFPRRGFMQSSSSLLQAFHRHVALSRIVSSNPSLPTTGPKRWLTLVLSPPVTPPSTINTSTTLHHHPAQVSSRRLCQSFCFSSTLPCRFALGIRMLFQSCDLGVPAFVQCSFFGWPRRVAVGETRF